MAKKSFMNNFKRPLNRDELQKAFYVDFEVGELKAMRVYF